MLRAGCAAAPALARGLVGTRPGGRLRAATNLMLILLSACTPDSAGPSSDVDLTAIEARLDALEDQHAADVAALQAQHDADVAALGELVAALEEALAALCATGRT